MLIATEIQVGDVIKIDGEMCKVLTREIKGTGKFAKMIHLKLKNVEDGHVHEMSYRSEEKLEDVESHHLKMQYLYRNAEGYVFMNEEDYEQLTIPEEMIGKQAVFLKENMEVDVVFVDERPVSIEFPRLVELTVTAAPPPLKGGGDTTDKEVELENGLKILVPQFVKEGEKVRVNTDDFSYVDRVTVKRV